MMKKLFYLILFHFFIKDSLCQVTYTSDYYQYKITIPESYSKKETVKGRSIDMSFYNDFGSTISIFINRLNVSYKADVSEFETTTDEKLKIILSNKNSNNIRLIKRGVIPFGEIKAYMIIWKYFDSLDNSEMEGITYHFIKNNFHYAVSCICFENNYKTSESDFLKTLRSFSFK